MSKVTRNDDGNDKRFTSSLNAVQGYICESLKELAIQKSNEWNVNIDIKPSKVLSCIPSNLCGKNCERLELCRSYRQIRNFFLRYGYIVYPYTLYGDGLPLTIYQNFGFFDTEVPNVLFVNVVFFKHQYRDTIFSGLNIAFHEFLHAISNRPEYISIIESINQHDFNIFVLRPRLLDILQKLYGKNEQIIQIETYHHYIANNDYTKSILDFIFPSYTTH